MDRIFGLDNPPRKDDLVLLASASNPVYLSLIQSTLDENTVPYLTTDRACGAVVKIVAGFSIYGADIYVLEKDHERACALLAEIPTEEEFLSAEIVSEDEDK